MSLESIDITKSISLFHVLKTLVNFKPERVIRKKNCAPYRFFPELYTAWVL